jgi:hypothetical protein
MFSQLRTGDYFYAQGDTTDNSPEVNNITSYQNIICWNRCKIFVLHTTTATDPFPCFEYACLLKTQCFRDARLPVIFPLLGSALTVAVTRHPPKLTF